MKELEGSVNKLSKNPLGILALLIVLVYGIAGIVASSNVFSNDDLTVLVWFLVLFPVIVLVALIYLVRSHHDKLYAPSDFTDEGNFVNLINKTLPMAAEFIKVNDSAKVLEEEVGALVAKDSDENEGGRISPASNTEMPSASKQIENELDNEELNLLITLRDGTHTYRTISGIASEIQLSRNKIRDIIFQLENKGLINSRNRGSGNRYFINTNGRTYLNTANK